MTGRRCAVPAKMVLGCIRATPRVLSRGPEAVAAAPGPAHFYRVPTFSPFDPPARPFGAGIASKADLMLQFSHPVCQKGVPIPPIIAAPKHKSSGIVEKMKAVALSPRQSQALDEIRAHVKRFGMPPTRLELRTALGIGNQAGVDRLLDALQRKGWIQLLPSVDRGIRLLREGAPILDPDELPAVAAGNPIVACHGPEPARLHDFDSLTERFEARPDWFVRVEGDSLDKVGFRSGDVLAVRRNPDPKDGDIVVARIGEEVVVKRFCRKDEATIELQPESHNPEHKPIRVTPDTVGFEVVGTVVGAVVGTRRGKAQ